jgi:hypothetical protein
VPARTRAPPSATRMTGSSSPSAPGNPGRASRRFGVPVVEAEDRRQVFGQGTVDVRVLPRGVDRQSDHPRAGGDDDVRIGSADPNLLGRGQFPGGEYRDGGDEHVPREPEGKPSFHECPLPVGADDLAFFASKLNPVQGVPGRLPGRRPPGLVERGEECGRDRCPIPGEFQLRGAGFGRVARVGPRHAAVGPAGRDSVRAVLLDLNRLVTRPVDRVEEGHRDDEGLRSVRGGPGPNQGHLSPPKNSIVIFM